MKDLRPDDSSRAATLQFSCRQNQTSADDTSNAFQGGLAWPIERRHCWFRQCD
jgi:hypothetical protein